ncbi:carbohydrate binding family 9 domain-containing protein [candidate division KSB1 bacterium]|nr:carbohydrate binding family 9 domain-containing protein [candidate division KSB1 bacterium]
MRYFQKTIFIVLFVFLNIDLAYSLHLAFYSRSNKKAGQKRIYRTQKIKSDPPVINGRLDDACWQEGEWAGDYTQQIPAEGKPPSQETALKILYDEHFIYIAIRAYDTEPEKIDRRLGRRDGFDGDIVGVCFDSYFDHRTGFEFDLTAAGGKIDLVLMNEGWDTNWDAVWDGKTAYEDSAWTAEMRVPLSQLRYADKEQHIWGLHAWRWINRHMEEDQWNLIPRDTPGRMYDIGELHGLKNLAKSRHIELLPYIRTRYMSGKEQQNPYTKSYDLAAGIGLDGKIGLSSDFTMDLTINPDFGQVEADPSVLNLTAFETFYDEKRPFFLEGKNILNFSFGSDLLFYSRRIGHAPGYYPAHGENEFVDIPDYTAILGAVKVTGKNSHGLSLGVIESVTSQEHAKIHSPTGLRKVTVEPLTNYFVARLQKDYDRGNSYIGGIMTSTSRLMKDEHLSNLNRLAYSGGIDFRHQWKKKTYYIQGKLIASYISGDTEAIRDLQYSSARYYHRPDAEHVELDTTKTSLSGHGGEFEIGKAANGEWRFFERLNWRSPGLELNDVGYLQTADNISMTTSIGYVVPEPISIFRNYEIFGEHTAEWDFSNQYLHSIFMTSFNCGFVNKWSFSTSFLRMTRTLDTRILRGGPAVYTQGFWHNDYSIQTDHSQKLSFDFRYHYHIYDDKISYLNEIQPGVNIKLSNSLLFSSDLNLYQQRDMLYFIPSIELNNSTDYLLAQLERKTAGMTFRIDWALSPELTIQFYGNPYVSVGKYSRYKKVKNPRAEKYQELYILLTPEQMKYDMETRVFNVDENLSGETDYIINNPNFNFREFRSNLVLRWEYKTGSIFYLVWAQGRSVYELSDKYSAVQSLNSIYDLAPNNIFLVKFNHWFAI